ncbi:hypothetical protein V8E54_001384 [Elaphomyces granulatus]
MGSFLLPIPSLLLIPATGFSYITASLCCSDFLTAPIPRITTHCANMTIDDRLYITPSIVPIMIGFYSYCLPARHPSRQCSPQRNLSHKIRSSAWELESIFGSLFSFPYITAFLCCSDFLTAPIPGITMHCANMTIDDRLYLTPSIVPIMMGFYSYCIPAQHPSRPQCSPQRNLSHKIRSSARTRVMFNLLVPTLYQFKQTQ